MKHLPLSKIEEKFGYIPHPESFNNNLQRLEIIAKLFNVDILDITSTDIGIVYNNNKDYSPVPSEKASEHHINDLSFIIFTE